MSLTTLITDIASSNLKTLFESLAKDFGDEIKHIVKNKILEYQVEEYQRNSMTKTLLHRVQPKNLKEFYQPLHIRSCLNKSKYILYFRERSKIPTTTISEIFNERKCITIVGSAGSGKSTLIKYLFLNSIDTKFKTPIKVELRYLNEYSDSLIEFIKDRIFKLNKLAITENIIERLLNNGNFVIFLDGYDEINSNKKEKITREIDELVKIYNKNNYILTSRPYTEIDLLPQFHNFEICELSNDEINSFIEKQLPNEEQELCLKIIEAVNNTENNSYRSFLSNPLLLSMFILTFQSYSNVPQKRSEFYSQVFDALFSVHDSMSKLAFVREKQSGLSKEQFIDVLKLFSFISYFEEVFTFSKHYLGKKLTFIKDKKKNIDFDNVRLICDLQIAIGILNQEGTDYTFPHRSLQEYFAALYIHSLNEENKKQVYIKIFASINFQEYTLHRSRENFYLLLSELDKISVIKYGIIPVLQRYLNETKGRSNKAMHLLSEFLVLRQLFNSFTTILTANEFESVIRRFSTRYNELTGNSDGKLRSYPEKKNDEIQEQLSNEIIRPFLAKFPERINRILGELNDYLISENRSDAEIVSII